MATILNTLIPDIGIDRIGVYDQNFVKIFPQAKSLKITVKEEAKIMEHPIETGATITDFRVILPVEIEISFVLQSEDYQDVYREIRQFFLNSTLLNVQTKAGVYFNQIIAALPHEEDPAYFDAITLVLKLKQVLFAMTQTTIAPRNPTNGNTVDRGTQQSSTVAPQKEASVLAQIDDWVKKKFG